MQTKYPLEISYHPLLQEDAERAKKLLDGLPLIMESRGGRDEPILRVIKKGTVHFELLPEGGNVSYSGIEKINKRKYKTCFGHHKDEGARLFIGLKKEPWDSVWLRTTPKNNNQTQS